MKILRNAWLVFGVITTVAGMALIVALYVYGGILAAIIKPIATADKITKMVGDFQGWIDRKPNGCLIGVYGEGETLSKAKLDYCKKISGQLLVMDSMLNNRKEIQLPPKITIR